MLRVESVECFGSQLRGPFHHTVINICESPKANPNRPINRQAPAPDACYCPAIAGPHCSFDVTIRCSVGRLRFAMLTCHSDVTVAQQEPSWFRISTRNHEANPLDDRWRDMFTINDATTAAINILGAIDALEAALDRHSLDADILMATDHERELLTLGIRDTQFILGMDHKPVPKALFLLSFRMANSIGISRTKASAALREFRLVEELAEGRSAPAVCAA